MEEKTNINNIKVNNVPQNTAIQKEPIMNGKLTGYPSIDKPWLKYYNGDELSMFIPDVTAYRYIYDINKDNLDQVVFNFLDKEITYKEFFENIDVVAKALINQGIKKGDIVTICMPNMPETAYLFYALDKIGAISDFLDPRANENVMAKHLKLAESKLLITIDPCYDMFKSLKEKTPIDTIVTIDVLNSIIGSKTIDNDFKTINWEKFLLNGKTIENVSEAKYEEDRPITILHTGGTTGIPKGAILTDKNLNALAIQWNNTGLCYNEHDKLLSLMPPFVSFGLAANLHMPLTRKMELILIPEYNPPMIISQIEKYKPNCIPASPAHWEQVYNYIQTNDIDFSSLNRPLIGGDILNPKIEQALNLAFKGPKMIKAFGLTEAATAVTLPYNSEMASTDSVGIPLPKTTVAIFDTDTLEEKKYGEYGEICVLTPNMMQGYYKMQEETDSVLRKHEDGNLWLHTGDIGYIDENGLLYVKGRIKKIIIRHDGIKIYSVDIESALLNCDIVDKCAVVGVKDNDHIQGEVPVAYVVLNNNIELNEDIKNYLYNYCKDNIIDYANPVDFVFVDSLTYTKNGKIDFKKLKEEYETNKTQEKQKVLNKK